MIARSLLAAALVATATPTLLPAQMVQPLGLTDADLLATQMRQIAANPRDVQALATAGELSLRAGDLSGAAALFARADKVDPRNGRVKAGMASILVRSERPGEALRFFSQAESYGWPAARFAADRGLAYDLIGEQERAQRDYRLALKGGSDDETARRYALSLGISGRQAQALEQLDPLLRRQDRAAWRARAFVVAMNGDSAGAAKIATTMMPPGMAQGLAAFFQRLPTLGAVDRAFAVHFGEVYPTPERLADARLTPALTPLLPEPGLAPVQVAAVAPPPNRRDRRSRRERERDRKAAATTAAPVALAQAAPTPVYSPAAQPPVVLAQARPIIPSTRTLPTPPSSAPVALAQARPAAPSTLSRVGQVTSPSIAAVTRSVPFGSLNNTPNPTPAVPFRETDVRVVTSVAPPPATSTAAPVVLASTPPVRTVAPPVTGTTPTATALPGSPPPVSMAAVPTASASQTRVSGGLAAIPPASTASLVATTTPSTFVGAPASIAQPIAVPVATAVAPAANVTPVRVAPVESAASTERADSVLARIVASLSIPASELGIAPVRPDPAPVAIPAAIAKAPASATGKRILAEASAKEARDAFVRRTVAARLTGDPQTDEPAARGRGRKGDDAKALAAADAKGKRGRKGAEEDEAPLNPKAKRAADRKLLADKKAEAEKKELADAAAAEKKIARTKPARIWVQVAGGANEAALGKAWRAAQAKAPALAGKAGYSTPLRATNRVLTGPFKTDAEARAFVNQLAKQGVSGFTFTSEAGQDVKKLDGK